jgi:hypothetical protein
MLLHCNFFSNIDKFYKNFESYESPEPLELLVAILYPMAVWIYGVRE